MRKFCRNRPGASPTSFKLRAHACDAACPVAPAVRQDVPRPRIPNSCFQRKCCVVLGDSICWTTRPPAAGHGGGPAATALDHVLALGTYDPDAWHTCIRVPQLAGSRSGSISRWSMGRCPPLQPLRSPLSHPGPQRIMPHLQQPRLPPGAASLASLSRQVARVPHGAPCLAVLHPLEPRRPVPRCLEPQVLTQ